MSVNLVGSSFGQTFGSNAPKNKENWVRLYYSFSKYEMKFKFVFICACKRCLTLQGHSMDVLDLQ